ncbi:MAG: recombination protein RecR [Candidatus Eisenbacteria bacterium]|uniref:Recombination protein RecR n=1 Tax=Eiseniibacteriota bacterium TaxID=2212470 RepID=A0A9D6L916_UNCEI|nr:recombination protein RecR [Candidatus Eisenbacteria bacterium]MBI3539880.1 recombination protein RecR [Candidatus Eisenbacteria bacterium]
MYSSKYLELLIEELAKLPSIGQKTAQRLALHILKVSKEDAVRLAEAIRAVKERVRLCGVCGNFSDEDPCRICDDPQRDAGLVCVVEQPGDVLAFERTGEFRGRYHVLGGALSPLDGTHPDDLRIALLLERLRAGETAGNGAPIREIILATNPNVAGEATALYLSRLLVPLGVRVTRIARGVPMGSDLEYSDQVTLARALEGRREVD